MQLYYSPGACSLASHIALREAGLQAELVRVDLRAGRVAATGEDFHRIHPMGQVPALVLDDGTVLTEGAAVLQYLADLAPQSQLAPAAGSVERYRLASLLNFVATELHKTFTPLFKPDTPAEYKAIVRADTAAVEYVAGLLKDGRSYLMGEAFTVADSYLFAVLRLSPHIGIDLARWPLVAEYMWRIAARLAVQEALRAEGLTEN